MLRWKYSRPLLALLLVVLAIAPMFTSLPLGAPGLQQTLAVAFVWGALALTYDLLFGFTGLLSSANSTSTYHPSSDQLLPAVRKFGLGAVTAPR